MKPYIDYIAAIVVLAGAATAYAGGSCCDHCGCDCQVRKVCRLICDVKKVPKVTYSCECEDFCVPGPSKHCGCTCEVDCNGCEKCKKNQVPQCAKVRTKTKLYKHVEMEEKKVYKWVVEYVCDSCANNCCADGACAGGACADGVPAQMPQPDPNQVEGEEQGPPQPPVPARSASTRNSLYDTFFSK
jgi:hypothetical protein